MIDWTVLVALGALCLLSGGLIGFLAGVSEERERWLTVGNGHPDRRISTGGMIFRVLREGQAHE